MFEPVRVVEDHVQLLVALDLVQQPHHVVAQIRSQFLELGLEDSKNLGLELGTRETS